MYYIDYLNINLLNYDKSESFHLVVIQITINLLKAIIKLIPAAIFIRSYYI
jgi:hypothetical protein